MQLTRNTDYGLRLLMYLALLNDSQKANIDDLSSIYGVSRNNLNKLVHRLGKAGIIETKRGKGGGFRLAKAPEDLNLGELVELLESTLQVVDCESPRCVILPACRLKNILVKATESFLKTLHNYTLADLVEAKRQDLIEILMVS
ncbi:MAG: Rrf2 family transcriptional regulator [Pseudomonadota bacterium]